MILLAGTKACVNGGIEIVNLAAEGFAYRAGMN